MSTHNICFNGELMKIILHLSSNTHLICSPDNKICIHENDVRLFLSMLALPNLVEKDITAYKYDGINV